MTALAALGERGAAIEHGLAHAALWQAELHAAPPSAVTELVERLRHGSGDLMVKSRDPGAVAGNADRIRNSLAHEVLDDDLRTREAPWRVVDLDRSGRCAVLYGHV